MITLRGTYADECNGPLPDEELTYVCRVIPYGKVGAMSYWNPIGQEVLIFDGDVLKACGNGTWFALYRNPKTNDGVEEAVAEAVAAFNAQTSGEYKRGMTLREIAEAEGGPV